MAGEPLGRIGDVGRDLAEHARDLVVLPRVAGLAQAYRHAGDQRLVGQLAFFLEIATQRAAAHRHHHVVQLGAARLGDRLGVAERDRARGIAALAGDGGVERRFGRVERRQLADQALQRAERLGHLARLGEEGVGHGVHDVGRGFPHLQLLAHHVAHDVGDALHRIDGGRRAGRRFGCGRFGWRRRHLARHRRHVVQRLVDRHAGAAVDRGVMDLRVENALAVLEAGDDVELPERTAAIERVGVQAADHLLELRLGAGRGQCRLAQMVVEVEVVGVDPAGMVEIVERRRQPLGEDRDGVQPAFEEAAEVPVETALESLGKLKVGQPRHVHGRLGRLEIEERRVDA